VIDDPKAAIEEYLQHRAMRERQIIKFLKEGPAKIPELVDRMYFDTPDELQEMAGRQVHAHLLKLRAEGKVAGRDVKSAWKTA
jgi:beta-lactamase-like protein